MKLISDDSGQVTAFVVILTTACLLFAGLVLDGGLALAAKTTAIGHAEQAARAGAQELDLAAYRAGDPARLDPAAATAAAHRYLHQVGATGTVTATPGSVRVTVTAHQPTRLLTAIGIGELTVTGTGSARPDQGPLGGPP